MPLPKNESATEDTSFLTKSQADMFDVLETYQDGNWMVNDNVPIFSEQENWDLDKLKMLIKNSNERIINTNDACPIVPGHNQYDQLPEKDVPVLGFCDDFKLGKFGKQNKNTIFARCRFFLEKWDLAKTLPRRSVEIVDPDMDTAFIDPLSLLSSSTPACDLGLMFSKDKKNSQNNKKIFIYNQKESNMDPEELKKLVAEMLESSEIGSWCREQMSKKTMAEEEKMDDMNDEGDEKEVMSDDKDEENGGEKKKEPWLEKEEYSLKAERDSAKRLFAKSESEKKQLAVRIEQLERKARIAEREKDLMQVEQEGVIFEFADELNEVADLDSISYDKHLARMRKVYSRGPVGVNIPTRQLPPHGLNDFNMGAVTTADVKAAANLVSSGKAKNSEEALRMVKGGI